MAITPTAAQHADFQPISIKYMALRRSGTQVSTSNPNIVALLLERGYRLFLTWTVTETSPNHRIITDIKREDSK